jgi:hypothetical protein
MQTTIGADPPDLIAYAFYRMGFRPRESLVLIGMKGGPGLRPGGGGGRMLCGMVARIDLPPDVHRRRAVEQTVRTVSGHGHGAVVALIVSDTPRPDLAATVRSVLRREDLLLVDLLAIGESSYRSYLCRDERCCPAGGFPLSEVESSRVAAELVLSGRRLGADEASIIADVLPDPKATLPEAMLVSAAGASHSRRERLRRLDLWRDLMAAQGGDLPAEVSPGDLADVCLGLEDVLFRDAVLVALAAPSGADGVSAARAMASGRAEQAMEEVDRRAPDPEVLERGRRVLSALARSAPPGRRAEVLALMSWAAWWQGEGGRGRLLAEAALTDRPDHRLAGLVLRMLAASLPPPWAGARTARGRAVRRLG